MVNWVIFWPSLSLSVDGYANLYLTPRDGVKVTDWSLYKTSEGHLYSMENYIDGDHGDGDRTHFVLYTSGYYSSNCKFWFELEVHFYCVIIIYFASWLERIFCLEFWKYYFIWLKMIINSSSCIVQITVNEVSCLPVNPEFWNFLQKSV